MTLTHSASAHVGTGTGEGLLAYLHTTLSVRISHFLLLVWASGGWGSLALSALVSHTFPRSFPLPPADDIARDPGTRRRRHKALHQLSMRSGLQRHYVLEHGASALSPHHRALTGPEQLALHVDVVWLTRYLELPRKEASFTREIIKRLSAMLIQSRQRLMPSSPQFTAPSVETVGLGLGLPTTSSAVAVRRRESTDGNDAVVALMHRVCDILGIDLIDLNPDPPDYDSLPAKARFGWPEIQVGNLQAFIAVAETLPDPKGVIRLCLSALKGLYPYLNPVSLVISTNAQAAGEPKGSSGDVSPCTGHGSKTRDRSWSDTLVAPGENRS